MTISVDTDGDGEPDAIIPLKWILALGPLVSAILAYLL